MARFLHCDNPPPHPEGNPRRFPHAITITAAVTSLVSLALYLRTLAPSISYGGDCGELISCAYTLGVAHPTGYPLYLMLGKVFTMLPYGDVAYRMNLMSAVFAALAAGVLCWLLGTVTGSVTSALFGALAFASGYGLWSQAVIAEVYSFNVFLGSVILLAALLWQRTRDIRWLYGVGFILGLSLGAHGMTFLTTPAYILWFLTNRREEPWLRTILIAALCAIAGAMVLWYLPLRALTHPPINWGNPSNWDRFLAHVTARQFSSLLLDTALHSMPHRFLAYLVFVLMHFAAFSLLVLAGMGVVLRQRPKEFLLFTLLLMVNSGLFLTFDQPGAYFQLLPSLMIFGLFAGHGCGWFVHRLSSTRGRWKTLAGYLPTCAFTMIWIAQVGATLSDVNMRDNFRASQDVAEVLQKAPRNSVVIAGFDQILFTLWYYRFVEGVRRDLAIEHTGQVAEVMARYRNRPAICPMFPPSHLPEGYYFEPVGTFGYVRKGRPRLRYIEPSSLPPGVNFHDFILSDPRCALSLRFAELHPPFMRREAMATLDTYWSLSRRTQQRMAAIYVFKFRGFSRKDSAQVVSVADRALLSNKQFGWTQYHPLVAGAGTDSWQPGRVVEDRLPIRPPWRVIEGTYSVHVAVVPETNRNDVRDVPLPGSLTADQLPTVGEIEIYMQ